MSAKKQCCRCNAFKPFSEYYRNGSKVDGYEHHCKECSLAEIAKIAKKYNPDNLNPLHWIGKEEPFPNTTILVRSRIKDPAQYGKGASQYVLADCLCGRKDIPIILSALRKGRFPSCSRTCPLSVRNKISNQAAQDFVAKAQAVHGQYYDYSKVVYKRANLKVEIVCPKHGTFKQAPQSHIDGNGCIKCTKSVSKPEKEWLGYIEKQLGRKLERQYPMKLEGFKGMAHADGYDPVTDTVYEFHGDYYHGNPQLYDFEALNIKANKTMLQLFEETAKRSQAIRKNHYLVSIWEADWKKLKKALG
jgi:hypothetical protein